MRGTVVLVCVLLTGCDRLLGLQHVGEGSGVDGRVTGDGRPCRTASGAATMKLFGGRTLGLAPTQATDTFLSSDQTHQTSNFGALDTLFVCLKCMCTSSSGCESVAGDDDDAVSLLRFELASEIPVCSAVLSATLFVNTNTDELGAGSTVAVHEVLEPWDEGTGVIATGVAGAASWLERSLGVPWATAGVGMPGSRPLDPMGTFDPEAEETAYPAPLDTAVVQRWVDDPATNHGMVLSVTGDTSDAHFYSSEAVDDAKRPGLQIVYMPP